MSESAARIPPRHRTLRTEVRDARDNWLDVSDQAERRKLQNRLHQRAWRRKRKETRFNQPGVGEFKSPWTGHGMLVPQDNEGVHAVDAGDVASRGGNAPSSSREHAAPDKTGLPDQHLLIPPILPPNNAIVNASLRSTRPSHAALVFPLSPDHLLITMVQYNVKRGILYNMALLGLSETLPPAKQSALLLPPLPVPSPAIFPPSLHSTALQTTTLYDSRIAVVPCPILRDNLIQLSGRFDMDELASDCHGGLFEGFHDTNTCGVMIWGEPWRAASWEMTNGFVRKWGFLLEGCSELFAATNQWRLSRGEEPICRDIASCFGILTT